MTAVKSLLLCAATFVLLLPGFVFGQDPGRLYQSVRARHDAAAIQGISGRGTLTEEIAQAAPPLVKLDLNKNGQPDFVTSLSGNNVAYVFLDVDRFDNETIIGAPDADIVLHGECVVSGCFTLGEGIATGDVNGDGYEDLLLGDRINLKYRSDGSAYVVYADASIESGSHSIADVAGAAFYFEGISGNLDYFGEAVTTSDLNGDGYDDIIIGAPVNRVTSGGGGRGSVSIFFGGPDLSGRIDSPSEADVFIEGRGRFDHLGLYMTVGDWNEDGFGDVAFSSFNSRDRSGRIWVLYGADTIPDTIDLSNPEPFGLTAFAPLGYASEMVHLTSGDFDGDGTDDLVIGAGRRAGLNYSGLAFVNYGPIAPGQSLRGGQYASQTVVDPSRLDLPGLFVQSSFGRALDGYDVDRDGASELLIGSKGYSPRRNDPRDSRQVGGAFLLGGLGGRPPVATGEHVTHVFRGSNDGWGDLTDMPGNIEFGRAVGLFHTGDNTPYAAVLDNAIDHPYMRGPRIFLFHTEPKSGLKLLTRSLQGAGRGAVDAGDFDGDGDMDLLITGCAVGTGPDCYGNEMAKIYRNDESGWTDINADLTEVGDKSEAQWGDYDGDGDLDVVMVGTNKSSSYSGLYENQEGTFERVYVPFDTVVEGSVDWGDYDRDGDLDIALAGLPRRGSSMPVTHIYENTGGSFENIEADLIGVRSGAVRWGDYDGDEDLDLLLTGEADRAGDGNGETRIYRNDEGTFVGADAWLPQEDGFGGLAMHASIRADAAWGDYDGDGDDDLALVKGKAYILENVGGTFRDTYTQLPDAYYGAMEWGDYEGDGDLDLLYSGGHNPGARKPVVYVNENGVFQAGAEVPTTIGRSDVTWADLDGDLDLDIITAGWGFYENRTQAFENPTDPEEVQGRARVDAAGRVPFGATGASVVFDEVSGSGEVQVRRMQNGPAHPDGIEEESVSRYRYVIEAPEGLQFGPSSEVRFSLSALPGVTQPEGVVVYKRETVGTGRFTALDTWYDRARQELVARTGSFSEFAFASNSNALPVELTQLEAKLDAEASRVHLIWETASETKNAGFDVERRAGPKAEWTKIGFVEGHGTTSQAQSYRFTDAAPSLAGTEVAYRLKQVDLDGGFAYSDVVTVRLAVNGTLTLAPAYPNPFSGNTALSYRLPRRAKVTLRVYDVLGRTVKTLVAATTQPAGLHKVTWSGRSDQGARLASGLYFVRLQTPWQSCVERVSLVR